MRQSSVRGCRFSFVFVYFIIKVVKCSPVPASFFPYLRTVSLGEDWIGDSYVLCGWVSSPLAVTSSTGCAGNNAVGKGARICFDSLEHKALEDADLLEHQRVLKSGTHICGPGVGAEGTLEWRFACRSLIFLQMSVCLLPLWARDPELGWSALSL